MRSSIPRPCFASGIAALLLVLTAPAPLRGQTLGKWVSGGGPNPEYELGGNPEAAHGSQQGGYIRSITPAPKEIGNLMTQMAPGAYLGKRLRLSGYVRTEDARKAVVLWFRVDGLNRQMLAIDNMQDRPIVGTTDWKKYELVVGVPQSSVKLAFGLILDGAGKAWVDGLTLEEVGPEVPTTGSAMWFPTGSNPEDYEMGGNPGVVHGATGGGYIRSKVAAPRTFASWASLSPAEPFLGKRARLSGFVRTEGVENWAGFWMRVDGPGYEVLAFDNMEYRPLKGTAGWGRYDVVLDVPAQAVTIMFGLILEGKGQAWFDGVTLEPVGTDVPATSIPDPFTAYYEGRYEEAAKLLAGIIARSPVNYSYHLFHFLALHRSGQAREAETCLAGVGAGLTDQKWPGPVVQFFAGRLSEDEVLKAAASADPKIDMEQRCEAYYYLAMAYVLALGNVQGDMPSTARKAQEYLEKCVATGVTTFVEYRAAQAELERLKK